MSKLFVLAVALLMVGMMHSKKCLLEADLKKVNVVCGICSVAALTKNGITCDKCSAEGMGVYKNMKRYVSMNEIYKIQEGFDKLNGQKKGLIKGIFSKKSINPPDLGRIFCQPKDKKGKSAAGGKGGEAKPADETPAEEAAPADE